MRVAWATYILVTVLSAACGDNLHGNNPPELQPIQLSTAEDTPVSQTLAVTDPDGDTLAVNVASPPAHGTVTASGTLMFTYTPEANFNGTDQFVISVSDGTDTISATVDVAISAVNDAPVGGADTLATSEDVARVIAQDALLANDTDVDGDPLTITNVTNATNGTVAISGADVTFTPNTNFVGNGTFEYTVSDGTLTTTVAVTVEVGGANDPPVAVDDTATTDEDVAVDLTTLVANDTDQDGQTLAVTAVSNPTNGAVTLTGGTVTFTPTADFNGTATFDYEVSDGVATDTGTVTVTVNPVNDAPIAVDDSATTTEDTAIDLANLLGNDVDVDGPGLSITAVANATNGSVTLNGNTATFTPTANFAGTASFEYTVSDGTLTDTALVTITVTATNDAPVAADDTATTDEDTALAIATATLLGNDTDLEGDTLTITAVANPTNGAVSLAGTTVTFTPSPDFAGTASFDYTVSDGTATDVGRVTITVNPINDAPVAANDTATVQADTSIDLATATLLANDADVDGDTLTITAVQNATNGAVSLGGGTVTFTPTAGFTGQATFEYVVSDGTATDVGLVTITVTSGPVCGDGAIASPEQCDDGNANPGDGCSATCTVEPGFTCAGEPSSCTTTCGDGIAAGPEACDDGNAVDTDGCTSRCVTGVVCNATAFPGADRFAVDLDTGHCYLSFDAAQTTFAAAETACEGVGGYLVTITSAGENTLANTVRNVVGNPWIGARDDANDTDDIFDWITDEPFTFKTFAPGEPDDDAGVGGNGECLHYDLTGAWADTNCNIDTFVIGRICEVEPAPCGDSVTQAFNGEECDDSNTTANDGCSATCQLETGCGNGTIDAGEECDDDNVVNGDGCSATCTVETGCGNGALDAGEQCDDDNLASGDGCSATCTLETLFFSEYVEGSSNNKALEIANPLNTAINLTGCTVRVFSNGSTTSGTPINLVANVAGGDVHVLCNNQAAPILALCDQTSSSVNYNGNDAVQLTCNGQTMDVIGQIGNDPGIEWGSGVTSTQDNTLRRRCGFTGDRDGSNPFDPAAEWTGFAVDTFAGLGDPTCAP
ncbi:MAG TPA: Ig-like domain-containing protein [Kofleriaceae bacterium]|nr:Ig-like domain-containing protein [Kofleriaceae bacterium]